MNLNELRQQNAVRQTVPSVNNNASSPTNKASKIPTLSTNVDANGSPRIRKNTNDNNGKFLSVPEESELQRFYRRE